MLQKHGPVKNAEGGYLPFVDTPESIMIRLGFKPGDLTCCECLHKYTKEAFSRRQLKKSTAKRQCMACIQARLDHDYEEA